MVLGKIGGNLAQNAANISRVIERHLVEGFEKFGQASEKKRT
jgi:hypothetical protein